MIARVGIYFWIFLFVSEAQEIGGLKDLGVLSPATLIPLLRQTDRQDFSHFEVEVMSSLDTNRVVRFTTTNEFIQLSDLTALPSGRMLLGLKSVSNARMESAVSLYAFTVWRSEMFPQPGAGTVILRPVTNRIGAGPDTLKRAFSRLRVSSTLGRQSVVPPLPSGLSGILPTVPGPLPNGKSETYARHLDVEAEKEMLRFYTKTGRKIQ